MSQPDCWAMFQPDRGACFSPIVGQYFSPVVGHVSARLLGMLQPEFRGHLDGGNGHLTRVLIFVLLVVVVFMLRFASCPRHHGQGAEYQRQLHAAKVRLGGFARATETMPRWLGSN